MHVLLAPRPPLLPRPRSAPSAPSAVGRDSPQPSIRTPLRDKDRDRNSRPPSDGGRSRFGRGGAGRTAGRTFGRGGRGRESRYTSPPPPSTRPKQTATFFSADSFGGAGASPALVDALSSLSISRPSHIQAAALRVLAPGAGDAAKAAAVGNSAADASTSSPSSPPLPPPAVVVADHAGSGKTLAYLVPIAMHLAAAEASQGRAPPCTPRAIVLAPTSELCAQVGGVARALARGLATAGHPPFRTAVLTGGHPWRTQRDALEEGADLVVATPGRVAEHVRAGSLTLDAATHIVLDEADVLLADAGAFADQVAPLKAAASPNATFVLVTATLPEPVWAQLEADFGGRVTPVLGPGLHRPAPGVTQQIVDCSGGDDFLPAGGRARKLDALIPLLSGSAATHTVIFCNTIDGCRAVENVVKRKLGDSHVAHAYHGAIDKAARDAALASFCRRGGDDPLLAKLEGGAPTKHVLIATDRASRGVDTVTATHVILFDFPRDPSEYVRRAGRVARGGAGGATVSLLVLGRQVPLARRVVERGDAGQPLHAVPGGG